LSVVRAENIKVRYPNGGYGLHGVSVTVNDGAVVALLGPNGAGKTTTVRAMSGFLRAEGARVVSGSIFVGGRDVTNHDPHVMTRLGVALVPERKKVFNNLTVAENLDALGRNPRRTPDSIDLVFNLFPVLAERRKERAGRLSGGQQQMLAIGRALATAPDVLIVDEMTLGLHQSLHEPLYAAIRQISSEGTAVLIVDESVRFALEIADYCYLLRDGRVRDEGPSVNFKDNQSLASGYVE
jgi:branched-chain amino acid transport system ATP-binding protein